MNLFEKWQQKKKKSVISQSKHVISPKKFIFEFKNAHIHLPGNAEYKRKK